MTYYKYKEREDPRKSMINWGEITKELSDGIEKDRDRRRDLKDELKKTHIDNLNKLEDFAVGVDPTRNQVIAGFANQYKDFLHSQRQLLLSGQVRPEDMKMVTQGSMDTFTVLNDAAKNYNESIAAIAEAGGNMNDFISKEISSLTDMKDRTLIIDPKTGGGSLAKVDENGNIIETDIVPVTKLKEIFQTKIEDFDLQTSVDAAVKKTGTWIEAASAYSSIDDLRNNDEYKTWKKNTVDAIMAQSMNGAQIADYYLGMEVTKDKALAESDPEKYILAVNKGGSYGFELVSDVAEQKVRDAIESQIEIAVGRKEVKKPVSEAAINAGNKRRSEADTFQLINDALGGDQSALNSLASFTGLSTVKSQNGQMLIEKGEENLNPIDLTTIGQSGRELAAALGLDPNKFDKWYKSNFKESQSVNIDAVQNFSPYSVTKDKKLELTSKELEGVLLVYNEDEEGKQVKATVAEQVNHAQQFLRPLLASKGYTDVTIGNSGDVMLGNTKLGTIVDGSFDWLTKLKEMTESNNKSGKKLSY